MKSKTPPENPFLPEHHTLFDKLVARWQKRFNLVDWRIVKKPGKTSNAAEVFQFEPSHRLVRYRLGGDNGAEKVDADSLEELAIHEMLHVRFNDMIDAAIEDEEYSERVVKEEHAVIVVLQKLLLRLAQLERELEERKKSDGSEVTKS